eukprot:jgi/Psemu1/25814/gm1.25814_g
MAIKSSHGDSVSSTQSKNESERDHSNGSVSTKISTADAQTIDCDGSFIVLEPLNDMIHSLQSSHSTFNSNSQTSSSFGESSLSSFLSVLLEDEENVDRKICIVPDNPKPEHRSVRDLHLTFKQSALENGKPKNRWDYITRDSSDHLVSLSRRRNKMEVRRSSSFSGSTSNAKRRMHSSNSFSLGHTNSAGSMFLRMPERKRSPTTNDVAARKQSVAARLKRINMSESGLMQLPLPSVNSSGRVRTRLARAGEHEPNSGNASWSNDDLRDRSKQTQNRFLNMLLEPKERTGTAAPKPATRRVSATEEGVKKMMLPLSAFKAGHEEKKPCSNPPKQPSRNTRSPRTPIRRMKSPPPIPHMVVPDLG